MNRREFSNVLASAALASVTFGFQNAIGQQASNDGSTTPNQTSPGPL